MEISNTYQNSILAQAGYIELPPGFLEFTAEDKKDTLISSLTFQGMTAEAAAEFASKYKVVDSINDPTGLQATVFEEISSGKKTLSIAGTDPWSPMDIESDVVDVGLIGSTNQQPQYAALNEFYDNLVSSEKLGASESFNVTGHSLGGFMAQAFTLDHTGVVNQTYTYNAPGMGGIIAEVFEALGVIDPNIAVSNITNYYAEDGVSVVSGLGTILGEAVGISVGDGLGHNHSIDTLRDAFSSLPPRPDPLAFDLDGDGLELTSLDTSQTYFDLDANGFAERTGWASGDDGFLTLDRNNILRENAGMSVMQKAA